MFRLLSSKMAHFRFIAVHFRWQSGILNISMGFHVELNQPKVLRDSFDGFELLSVI